MDETDEGNPAINFKKTVIAQTERVKSAENPIGLIDRFMGKKVSGKIDSSFTAGGGGEVRTQIQSGGALLSQSWTFDKDGKITSVEIKRQQTSNLYDKIAPDTYAAGKLMLKRGEDGKFYVHEEKSEARIRDWQRDFNTASRRIQDNKDIPSNSKPQPPQK